MQFSEVIGLSASFLSCITFMPQVYKAWKTKSISDLSIYTILIIIISSLLWLLYGIFNNPLLLPVVLCNGIICLLGFLLLYFKITFQK
ncbi:MAG: SemiSWEET family sugar transporter [Chitinophagales bacterium]